MKKDPLMLLILIITIPAFMGFIFGAIIFYNKEQDLLFVEQYKLCIKQGMQFVSGNCIK